MLYKDVQMNKVSIINYCFMIHFNIVSEFLNVI